MYIYMFWKSTQFSSSSTWILGIFTQKGDVYEPYTLSSNVNFVLLLRADSDINFFYNANFYKPCP